MPLNPQSGFSVMKQSFDESPSTESICVNTANEGGNASTTTTASTQSVGYKMIIAGSYSPIHTGSHAPKATTPSATTPSATTPSATTPSATTPSATTSWRVAAYDRRLSPHLSQHSADQFQYSPLVGTTSRKITQPTDVLLSGKLKKQKTPRVILKQGYRLSVDTDLSTLVDDIEEEMSSPQKPLKLDEMPNEVLYCILEFLLPDEILELFGMLNSRCRKFAICTELWEERLQIIHPIIDLLDLEPDSLAERRSKGRVQLACLKGIKKKFAIRSVSLEMTNAGKDDGIPTSCLRELSLATGIKHPNIARCYGGSVDGSQLKIVTEYCGPSLYQVLTKPTVLKPQTIKTYTRQLFSATEALHRRGVIHRNIKTDNIVVQMGNDTTQDSIIKLTDLAMGRAIDFPIGMYTPEDPKERDRSFREQRRLYNRAPELILRQLVYGLEVDIWSIGCVFVEMILGVQPFRCETEIGLIMSSLQVCGTPPAYLWERLSCPPETFLKLPQWSPIDFRAVALVISNSNNLTTMDVTDIPLLSKYKSQADAVKMLIRVGRRVGIAGLHLLERLFILPGCFRVTCTEALQFPYFTSENSDDHPEVLAWMKSFLEEQSIITTSETSRQQRVEGISEIQYYDRFVHAMKHRGPEMTKTKDSAFWEAIHWMEQRSVHLPARFGLLASVRFDFAQELERSVPQEFDVASMTPAPALCEPRHAPTLTPAPRRPKRLLRRRRESATPTETELVDFSIPRDQRSDFLIDDNTADEKLSSCGDSDYRSSLIENQSSYDGLDSDAEDLDFEFDFSGVEHPCQPDLSSPQIWNNSTTTTTHDSVSREEKLYGIDIEINNSKNEEIIPEIGKPISAHLPERCRREIALSQSPLNATKLRGNGVPKQPKSWRQVFWLWGRNWEHLDSKHPTMKRSAAKSWISRNTGQKSQFLSSMLEGNKTASIIDLPPCKLPRVSPRARMDIVNYMIGIQPELILKSPTVHIAIGLFDRYCSFLIGYPDEFSATDFVPIALACLKIADLYNELSKEYYKQDNISEYSDFTATPPPHFLELIDHKGRQIGGLKVEAFELLAEEKQILNTLRFDVLVPTVCWFVDTYLSVGKLLHFSCLVDYCHYLADFALLSHQLLAYRPALKAQVILLIASCSLLRPYEKEEEDFQSSTTKRIIKSTEPEFVKPLEDLLRHFIHLRDQICEINCMWEVLDCVNIFRDVLLNGRRYFESVGLRNVEKLHPWVSRLAIPVPAIPPRLIKIILPTSEDILLVTLSS